MNSKSQTGSTFRSVRHRNGVAVEAESAIPERAVEHSLARSKGNILREYLPLDDQRSTTFNPSKAAEAEDRIGVERNRGEG